MNAFSEKLVTYEQTKFLICTFHYKLIFLTSYMIFLTGKEIDNLPLLSGPIFEVHLFLSLNQSVCPA